MNDELRVKNNELGGKMKYRYRTDEEMKDSGVEWIGEIPKEWSITKLKYISCCEDGKRVPLSSDERGKMQGDIPYWGANSIIDYVNDYLIDYEVVLLGEDGAPFFDKTKPVAFYSNGKIWPNNHIHILKSQKDMDSRFLVNSLNIVDYKNYIKGSTRDKLTQADMKEIIIQIPKLKKEQIKISKFLDEKTAQFDSIISKKEALIEKLEEAKKSLISEVVTGKVRVVKTDDGYELVERKKEEMKDSGVEWLGDIPIEWDISKLKYIGESITGLTYSPKDIVDENKGILVLRSSNVQNGKIVFEDNVYVDMNIPDKLITKIGDIIICSRNGSRALIGKNACIREEQQGMSFGAFMTIFRSRYFEYLNFVFNSEIFKAQSGSFLTSTINQLTISNLNSFIIPLPNFKEQNIVVMYLREKISEYDKILDNIKMQIEKLKEAKQSLISEAVTGKIEILD